MIDSQELFRQILCGGKITDKLLGADLSFDGIRWSSEVFPMASVPESPGREFSLESNPISGFPKKAKLILDNDEGRRERGRLLHYFANHELLAIETMALTLLRFPDAPMEFKKGVFKTLQDEQRHLRLYLSRMSDYGVKLGDAPLSFYFWNRLRAMNQPLDFVVRMSMTFEQANLDFALEYATLFESEMDDRETASLLRTVHDDEVKHVGHGVKWFKEWKSEDIRDQGEWRSYLKELPYPLNARRAKGSVFFSAESRLAAGLSEAYVQSVKIAGGSRGRVPDYYLFNPECEIENTLQDLPKVLTEKIRDLAPVMLWLAHGEDVVELPMIPDADFQKQMFDYRGELPEMVSEEDVRGALPSAYELIETIRPWGWGKKAWSRLNRWNAQVRKHPSFTAEQMSDRLFSKSYWKRFLLDHAPNFAHGETIESLTHFESWLSEYSSDDHPLRNQEFIFKISHSTSGRGHVVFRPSCIDAEVKKLLQKKNLQGVVEPFHDKVADFSVQYEIQSLPEGLKIKRFEPRLFFVDDQLQYLGAWLGPIPHGSEWHSAWKGIEKHRNEIQEVHEKILQHLLEIGYVGPVGIDAMVIRDFSVVPVIEVNVRYTMGRVAHALESILRKKSFTGPASLRFHSKQELKRKGMESFQDLASTWPLGSFMEVTPRSQAQSTWVVVHFDENQKSLW